jgi:hypothetical protein
MEKQRPKHIFLTTSDVFFTSNSPPRAKSKKASARSSLAVTEQTTTTQTLISEREAWRPKVGPLAEIPQKSVAANMAENNQTFEESEKLRLAKIRRDWKPNCGMAAMV